MKNIIFLILSLFVPIVICGQSLDTLRGLIKDSTGNPIPGANVWVYSGTDTLHNISNDNGRVIFPIRFTGSISIKVTSLGYTEGRQTISDKAKFFEIVLKEKTNVLKEFVVKGIVSPVVVKKDTVEYDVSQYMQHPDDVIQEILSRLPGLQVNPDGSISMMGQKVTKIRINGQDFMVDDIKTLTSIIPASLINKIQLIDDYGEQSRLTGRRSGESQKVINLNTDKKINDIYFGRLMAAGGTDNLYALYANVFKNNSKQSISLLASNNNIGINTGKTSNTELGATFRKNPDKNFSINSSMNFKKNSVDMKSEGENETITSEGSLFNKNSTSGNNKSQIITPKVEVKYTSDEKNSFTLNLMGTIQNVDNVNEVVNYQTGFQKKDQITNNLNHNNSTNYSGSFLFLHKFNKVGRGMYLQLDAKKQDDKRNQDMYSMLRYYDTDTTNYKDSTLHQLINGRNKNYEIKAQMSYVEPVGKDNSLELKYFYGKSMSDYSNVTNWLNENGKFAPVDSLSNNYNFSIQQQNIEINFQRKKSNFEYTIGANVRPFLLVGNTRIGGFPVFPVFQFYYNIKNSVLFKVNYTGENIFPGYQQLSNVPDYSDLQNPVYGNPDLKAGTRHNIVINYFKIKNKNTFIYSLSGGVTKNAIVNNIVLVEDALGTVKQATYFINSNGNYNVETNNEWQHEFNNSAGSLNVKLGGSYSSNILYYNNQKWTTRTVGITDRLGVNFKIGIINFSPNLAHTFNSSFYPENSIWVKTHTYNLSSYNSINFSRDFIVEIIPSKQFTGGFGSGSSRSPFLLDSRINKWWCKRKIITVLECYNLFNEKSIVSQSLSGNKVSASANNIRGRYFLLKMIFDFNKIR